MKHDLLSSHVQMLFALLRASLHEREVELSYFQNVTIEDWKQCRQLAVIQGVMALAWDGIMKLPAALQPPRAVKLPWATSVENYEKKYLRYCSAVDELSRFYADYGIVTMQLKGVGFSSLYPVPCHREGGDIDIYTYSADKNRMSDEEANMLANTLMQQQGIEVDVDHTPKHSSFYYKGIPIENHRTFLNVTNYKIAKQLERLLMENMNPQKTALVVGEVLIPSPVFNTLFIAFHAAQHYGSGLALHHLCDWVMVIRHFGGQLPKQVTDKYFLTGVAAMTRLCNQYLGTSQPVEGGERIAKEMIEEILFPKYSSHISSRNKLAILLYKTRRMLYNYHLKTSIFHEPLVKLLWRIILFHMRKPQTIFQG